MKKIKVLALVMIFAFAALGGAYAWWTDTIYVNETVKTGIVDVQWVDFSTNDPEQEESSNLTGSLGGGVDPNLPAGDYHDVGYITEGSTVAGTKFSDDSEFASPYIVKNSQDVLNFTLNNGYPGYSATIWGQIKNVGTVPVRLGDLVLAADSDAQPDWLTVEKYVCTSSSDTTSTTAINDYLLEVDDTVWVRITETVSPNTNVEVPQALGGIGGEAIDLKWQCTAIQWNATTTP